MNAEYLLDKSFMFNFTRKIDQHVIYNVTYIRGCVAEFDLQLMSYLRLRFSVSKPMVGVQVGL